MVPLNRARILIVLLFSLATGSMSMAAAAGMTEVSVIGTITAIDTEKRQLIVTPVRTVGAAGERASGDTIRVRLQWDSDRQIPFTDLLPGCASRGNVVRINGISDSREMVLAQTIHGCGAGDFRDNTGVRYRLNRVRGACAPQ